LRFLQAYTKVGELTIVGSFLDPPVPVLFGEFELGI
jgi:hypothetical protein